MGPVIGVLADNSKSKYGRRRPFMIVGAIIVSMGLFILGWTTEIVSFFIAESELVRAYFTRKTDCMIDVVHQRRVLTITLAVLSIYLVDFAINASEI